MKDKNKIYITLSVFALLSLCLAVFFVWPLFEEIGRNSQNLISAKDAIVSLSAQINEDRNFQNNYETYKPNLEKIDQLFINPNNPVSFLEFLENTAYNSQVASQNSLAPNQPAGQNFINFRISSEGSFPATLDFLKKIESGPYLVEVENLTIQNPQNTGASKNLSSGKVDATFSIKAFIKK